MPKNPGSRQRIVQLVSEFAEPVAEGLGLELVDVDYLREAERNILRLTIDKPEGVSHEDCQALSQAVSDRLDELDPIPDSYYLEVSSPGVERPLKKEADFQRFAGQEVALHLFAGQEGRKVWQGILRGLDNGQVLLEVDGGVRSFAREQISRAHLVFHF